MELRTLRTFVAVAERLHFRRAAEALYLSQPTVTAHVQALEAELGTRLFERRGRALALTAAGARLLPHARRALGAADDGQREVAAWRHGYDERLRLVASIFVAASALPAALRRLLDERPRLDLSLQTAFSADVIQAVDGGRADLGLSRSRPAGRAIAYRQVHDEPVVAVAPAAWGAVGFEAACLRPLFTHNHPGYWDRVLGNLRALGLTVRPMEVGQVEVTRRLVEEGVGWSLLPRSAVEAGLGAGGTLREVPLPAGLHVPRTGTWAVWPAGVRLGGAAERLLELLAAAMPGATGTHPGEPVRTTP